MWELCWIHVGVVVERDVGVGEELRYKEGELLLWDSAWSACVQPGKSGLTMSKARVVGDWSPPPEIAVLTGMGAAGGTEPLGC